MPERILIVEDNWDTCEILRDTVRELGFLPESTDAGSKALDLAAQSAQALALIDVNLSGEMDGFAVCESLRRNYPRLPIIMVTSRAKVEDRVRGLDLGADDYILKPFSREELKSRIKALLRRTRSEPPKVKTILQLGDLQIDPENFSASLRGQRLELTVLEFDILHFFAQRPGVLCSRSELMQSLWGHETEDFAQSITTYLSRLRSKLEKDPKKPQWIKTIYGKGYIFTQNEAR